MVNQTETFGRNSDTARCCGAGVALWGGRDGAAAFGACIGKRQAGGKVASWGFGAWQGGPWGLLHVLLARRAALFSMGPVAMGIGIALWFAARDEPGPPTYALWGIGFCVTLAWAALGGDVLRVPMVGLASVAVGYLAAGVRAAVVAAPILAAPYDGPVLGRVIEVDRSASDARRITLDQVWLVGLPATATPHSLRISLRGDAPAPIPGAVVMVTGHLSAPDGPSEPGGFDFRRLAYFQRLGAVGYATGPVVLWAEPVGWDLTIARLRLSLGHAIQTAIGGDAGAFAAGAMTGDRSELPAPVVKDLRDSGLAHLLAISGMNLAFLVGFVFAVLRGGVALIPPLALRINSRKLAAAVSLPIAGFYLVLSGANLATERAFVMVVVMLGAILCDRRALTLRSVTLAGAVLLLLQLEALVDAGFQMSFAATVSLILGFRAVNDRFPPGSLPWWVRQGGTVVLSSVLGGLATAPFAALQFNRFQVYGLAANLLTVPVMGAVVMPAGAVAAVLAPLGLAEPALWVMARGVDWILAVAAMVARAPGAVLAIPGAPEATLPLLVCGASVLLIWPGRARWTGFAPVLLGMVLWLGAARPIVLISGDGRLVGVMTETGRALSAARGAGYVAQNWLLEDGDLAPKGAAARRPGWDTDLHARRFPAAVAGVGITQIVAGKDPVAERAAVIAGCAAGGLVVMAGAKPADTPAGCVVLDGPILAQTGAIALDAGGADNPLRLRITNDGRRQWQPGAATVSAGLAELITRNAADDPAVPKP